ncbi:MAG: N-6 DNA methylase, partial [Myxococcota bacterium]
MIKETHSSSSIIHNSSSDLFALALRHCHARIRDRQGLSRAQAFQEILKLLFCKTHDETHGTGTAFRVDAADSDNKTASARLIERLNTLLGRVKARYPTLFRPADAFQLDPDVLTEIAAQLQNHPLSGSDADVEGKLYDEMVG